MSTDILELAEFAPEGIPERPMIPHRSGTLGIQQIRGNNIRIERIHLKKSRGEFAESIGISKEYLRKIEEGGAIPRMGVLSLIAKRLKRTIADLDRYGD